MKTIRIANSHGIASEVEQNESAHLQKRRRKSERINWANNSIDASGFDAFLSPFKIK